MKKNEILKTTTNSTVYRKVLKTILFNEDGLCPICPPHSGCNGGFKPDRSWKYNRKTQYKEVKNRNSGKNEKENEI